MITTEEFQSIGLLKAVRIAMCGERQRYVRPTLIRDEVMRIPSRFGRFEGGKKIKIFSIFSLPTVAAQRPLNEFRTCTRLGKFPLDAPDRRTWLNHFHNFDGQHV